MRIQNVTKITALAVGVAACMALTVAHATPATVNLSVGLTDPYSVGTGVPGINGLPGGQAANESADVNYLVAMGLNTAQQITAGNFGTSWFDRSGNFSSPLPTANITGASLWSGSASGDTVTITLSEGFTYLVARYDGQNAGAQVWDIAGLFAGGTTTLVIPSIAHPVSATVGPDSTLTLANGPAPGTTDQYQITSYTLFNPSSVPDGASTAMLLGIASLSVGMLKRHIAKQ